MDAAARRLGRLLPCLLLACASGLSHALAGEVVATGLAAPLQVTAPAGDGRLFVVEKGGLIRVIAGGSVQATPFLDLSSQVATAGEQGLLGLAFDPGYASNGRFYVNYIDATTRQTVIARYTAADPAAMSADPGSAQTLLSIAQPNFENHKGGWMGFRPGEAGSHLYIATGDGGSSNDPQNNAQNGNSLLGKMLRIDVSQGNAGYAVPADNPFVGQAGMRGEIWALGLRNPFRNSFDRATGDLWIADVGQGQREEINLETAADPGGHNYGWRLREGSIPTPGVGGDGPGLTGPLFEYSHASGMGESIIGGYVYRGPSIADADGRYFFGDFISNRIFSFALGAGGAPTDLRDETTALLGGTGLSGLDSFGEDGQGRLYAVGINGTLVRMVPEPTTYLLLLSGLVCIGFWVARQRRRQR